jgi:hypothetical protein
MARTVLFARPTRAVEGIGTLTDVSENRMTS